MYISKRGFSLIELLVVLILLLIVGSLAFWTVIKILSAVSTSAGEAKQEVEIVFNTEWLIFDLKHAGYGISVNETTPVLSYCNGTANSSIEACNVASALDVDDNKLLLIKETSNIVRSDSGENPSIGFILCKSGTEILNNAPGLDDQKCVAQDGIRRLIGDNVDCSCSAVSSADFATLFPYWTDGACKGYTGCCQNQYCTGIAWFLDEPTADSGAPEACLNVGTKILYRAYTEDDGSFNKTQVIPCIADWDVWFGLDSDNDTVIDRWVNYLPTSDMSSDPAGVNAALARELKIAKVYFLVQSSYQAEPDYDYCTLHGDICDSSTCGAGKILVDTLKDSDGTEHSVCLKHPDGETWKHYRWKVVQINVSPFVNIPQPLTTP
jgi:prepilin-type N-terminal cleavage/methylation domain-containing protein